MKIEVTGCSDCPFEHIEFNNEDKEFYCGLEMILKGRSLVYPALKPGLTPDYCRLTKVIVTK